MENQENLTQKKRLSNQTEPLPDPLRSISNSIHLPVVDDDGIISIIGVMSKKKQDEIVWVIFPVPKWLVDEIDKAWHRRALKSRAATIRALLREALAK